MNKELTYLAEMALVCIPKEYPNHIVHMLNSDADVQSPRELHPAFYGCFDWHSAVHNHWLLARIACLYPSLTVTERAISTLSKNLTTENIQGEISYFEAPNRVSFEAPYGLAWLLMLCADLSSWDHPVAKHCANALKPLETLAADRLYKSINKLTHPIRTGTHNQTAFSLSLAYDWARKTGAIEMEFWVTEIAQQFYLEDRDAPISYEPSGHDFLSPCLSEADLMRRLLSQQDFSEWLYQFAPWIDKRSNGLLLEPAPASDPEDWHQVHLDGLNLSRAWMLQGIASALPNNDRRVSPLLNAAKAHCDTAIPAALTHPHYSGTHWLGTLAVYLLTHDAQ